MYGEDRQAKRRALTAQGGYSSQRPGRRYQGSHARLHGIWLWVLGAGLAGLLLGCTTGRLGISYSGHGEINQRGPTATSGKFTLDLNLDYPKQSTPAIQKAE